MVSIPLRPFLAALAIAVALSACDSPAPRPTFADLHFTSAPPIRLAVSEVDIRSEFHSRFQSPNVEHLFPVPPQHALENWAQDRLKAGGGAARARFTILDAAVLETNVKKKDEGLKDALTKRAAERYDASVEARLEIVDATGLAVRTVSVKAARTQSVLEGTTPNEREQAWYDMTKALMAEFDARMSAEISERFGGYFQ